MAELLVIFFLFISWREKEEMVQEVKLNEQTYFILYFTENSSNI